MHELLLRISSTPWHTQTKMRRGSSQNNYILSLRTLPTIVSSVIPLGTLQLSVLPFNSSSCAAILRESVEASVGDLFSRQPKRWKS